jgi:hypothetical protein
MTFIAYCCLYINVCASSKILSTKCSFLPENCVSNHFSPEGRHFEKREWQALSDSKTNSIATFFFDSTMGNFKNIVDNLNVI